MRIDNEVPFVGNLPDDLHCYSASLAMIVGRFIPEAPATIDTGNRISSKSEGKVAWPIAAPLWLLRHGFEVVVIFDFDYQAVAELGIEYIRARYGGEVAQYQEDHSDMPSSDEVKAFLDGIEFEKRVPDLSDIRNALTREQLVAVTVNANRLKREDGYMNHSVVVKGITETEVILHNPGLPPTPNQRVSHADFIAAWSDPSDDARYMMSVGTSLERPLKIDAVLAALQGPVAERTLS